MQGTAHSLTAGGNHTSACKTKRNLTKILDKTKGKLCKRENRMKVKGSNVAVNKHKYIVTQKVKKTIKKLLDFLLRLPSDGR